MAPARIHPATGLCAARATMLDARPSQSRPDRGLVRFRFDMLKSNGIDTTE